MHFSISLGTCTEIDEMSKEIIVPYCLMWNLWYVILLIMYQYRSSWNIIIYIFRWNRLNLRWNRTWPSLVRGLAWRMLLFRFRYRNRSFLLLRYCHRQKSPSEPLPLPTVRGDNLSIKITEALYTRGLERWRHHIHGRLFLNKGDKPYTAKEVTAKLSKHWKTKGTWELIPLGRGFYEFEFSNDDDMQLTCSANCES